ncbi:MAG: fatty acid oxidation complex subunit alpha FadB [Pseudomonadales bacterium]|nr:fatty acid oxidation complex subunit alpha FadB [Pseudomonadales bacterium]
MTSPAVIYQGKAIQVELLDSGIAQLTLNLPQAAVNVFNQLMLNELQAAVTAVATSQAKALMCVSGKSSFVVGADISEFTQLFKLPEKELLAWCEQTNAVFNALEDLPVPSISVIDGMALGGGLELCLATDLRLGSEKAVLGFPEVKLGICPGFGGTVRATRLLGLETACDWIISGRQLAADQALSSGALDAVVAADILQESATAMLDECLAGSIDYLALRQRKKDPLAREEATEPQIANVKSAAFKAGRVHYPAPVIAVDAICAALACGRAEALQHEHKAFVQLAHTPVAGNLVQLFLSEQYLKRTAKKVASQAHPVARAAVIGAGIMGGGIAYQSALTGTPILMKDIAQQGLDLGMDEAEKHSARLLKKGQISAAERQKILDSIAPTLEYTDFSSADVVVEAVIENVNVKNKVLAEVEQTLKPTAVLTSNTSTISISLLARALQQPQNFCGMHFFNPVALMPLVEVIRGDKSSEQTIATTVAYAQKMGKTPIVVNDCPGFLVNRILFPYFGAFAMLIRDGADFRDVDRVMEAFGWPMGPAYLLDVVGIDTAAHAMKVMAEGFPDRMRYEFHTVIDFLHEQGSYGQKNGRGFYRYQTDENGRLQKMLDDSIISNIQTIQTAQRQIHDREIVERLMVAMCLETVRCLEDGIIDTAIEADMGLVLGLGFPRFRGGALRYIDSMGAEEFCTLADRYAELGPLYQVTAGLRAMAAAQEKFYP